MNKKLLLGALIGAGISMLNKRRRQAPQAQAPNIPPPDFSRVPPPTTTGAPQDSGLDDIFGRRARPGAPGTAASPGGPSGGASGDIFGGAIPAGGGAAVLMDIARRIFQQMQQGGRTGASSGTPGASGNLNDILGQIFGRLNGKFGQQGPMGQGGDSGAWRKAGRGGLFGFAANDSSPHGQEQAELMLHAMVAAAQADGEIDAQEQRNILGALEGQLERSELRELQQLLATPVNIDEVLERVQDPATAFDIYLVSAMTINEDNAREHAYMDELAAKLGISEEAAHLIEEQVPHAA
ncbi:Protein of unknown function [Microbulbifer donghaiensis]|uniref:Uncharacterized protein n=1 Tax=Microbulbifer donghaiensis TaxID=494016 RepID=A0A1M5B4H9_9GAMM|nr:DUF533 domain-containing protein [Microbulbifer donghaiensis]SHF37369.1 Protein of unknown function [Microbulbifer donghaiensis]